MSASDIDSSAIKQAVRRPSLPPGERAAGNDDHFIKTMEHVSRSRDYVMILASFSLGLLTAVVFLQGFRIGGFYLDPAVLTALVPSLSVAPALRALGWPGRTTQRP